MILQACNKIPQHVAIIMDGNGRWAKQQGLARFTGHEKGVDTVKRILRACAEKKIAVLSLFAFGNDNWSRPPEEVQHLMGLFIESLDSQLNELHDNNIVLRFSGDRAGLRDDLCQRMLSAENLTRNNSGLILNIAINYSGQWDIVQAVKTLAEEVNAGTMDINNVTADTFAQHLVTRGLPEVDLFIRTSGEQRVSNFFLWQLSYAELYFCDDYWPDFSLAHFEKALEWFSSRERRYGLTSEQVIEDGYA